MKQPEEILPAPAPEEPREPVSSLTARPDEAWIRGTCPLCGEAVISNVYHAGGKGYIVVWECWASLQWPNPSCDYRRVQ